jgi:hypothetical protein
LMSGSFGPHAAPASVRLLTVLGHLARLTHTARETDHQRWRASRQDGGVVGQRARPRLHRDAPRRPMRGIRWLDVCKRGRQPPLPLIRRPPRSRTSRLRWARWCAGSPSEGLLGAGRRCGLRHDDALGRGLAHVMRGWRNCAIRYARTSGADMGENGLETAELMLGMPVPVAAASKHYLDEHGAPAHTRVCVSAVWRAVFTDEQGEQSVRVPRHAGGASARVAPDDSRWLRWQLAAVEIPDDAMVGATTVSVAAHE